MPSPEDRLRGPLRAADANADRLVDVNDAVFTLGYLFLAQPPPLCPDAADANDDGRIDVSDPVAILSLLFLEQGTLPPPFEVPAEDPTPDAVRCGHAAR